MKVVGARRSIGFAAGLLLFVSSLALLEQSAEADAPLVQPVIEYGMMGDNATAAETLIYHLSGGNGSSTNQNGVYDGPESTWINGLKAFFSLPQDGIFDGSIAFTFPTFSSVSTSSFAVNAAKQLLRKAGYGVYTADIYLYTFVDAASMSSFKSHRGLTANSTVDGTTWQHLFWHYQEIVSSSLPWGICLGDASGNWEQPEALGWTEWLGFYVNYNHGQMLAITDIANEHGGDRSPHSSHKTGMDLDARLNFLFVDPCTTPGDIRSTANYPNNRCATAGETVAWFLRSDQEIHLQAVRTTATGSPFLNYAKVVFFQRLRHEG